jgi:hypothetical protein
MTGTEEYTAMRHREVLADLRRLERLKARCAALRGKIIVGPESVELREVERAIEEAEAEIAGAA